MQELLREQNHDLLITLRWQEAKRAIPREMLASSSELPQQAALWRWVPPHAGGAARPLRSVGPLCRNATSHTAPIQLGKLSATRLSNSLPPRHFYSSLCLSSQQSRREHAEHSTTSCLSTPGIPDPCLWPDEDRGRCTSYSCLCRSFPCLLATTQSHWATITIFACVHLLQKDLNEGFV